MTTTPGRAVDAGGAGILVLAIGLVVLLAGLGGQAVGAAAIARHRAEAAADLGALGGALHVSEGPAAACRRAAALVRANGATLRACTLDGAYVTVRAEVTPAGSAAAFGQAHAAARAGPLTPPPR